MIAVDTSTFIAYLAGAAGADAEALDEVLAGKQVVIPPVVLSELLSDPKLPKSVEQVIRGIPLLEIGEGYWERVGRLRAKLLSRKLKARLADALIAQVCIDHDTALITRDDDFRHFARYCGLKLI